MLLTNFGFWEFWENFPQKVTFDGINKLILINEGEIEIDIQIDVYSNWKEWVEYRDNSQYLQAMSSIGGDITPTGAIGGTYFLENGWKIKPWAGSYKLNINGNMYSRDGSDPFVEANGTNFKVTISQTVSNIVDTVGGGQGATESQIHAWLNSYLNKDDWKGSDDALVADVASIKGTVEALPTLLDMETSLILAREATLDYIVAQIALIPTSNVDVNLDPVLNAIAALNDVTPVEVRAAFDETDFQDKNSEGEIHIWLDSYLNKADWGDSTSIINAIAALNDVTAAEVRAAFVASDFQDKNSKAEIHSWLDQYVNKDDWKGLTTVQEQRAIDTKIAVDAIEADTTSIRGTVNILPTLFDIENSTIIAKTSDISVVEAIVNSHPTLAEMRDEMINIQFGGLEIANNQMTLKDKAGAVIAIFDLFDKNGNPTMLSVFKREIVL